MIAVFSNPSEFNKPSFKILLFSKGKFKNVCILLVGAQEMKK